MVSTLILVLLSKKKTNIKFLKCDYLAKQYSLSYFFSHLQTFLFEKKRGLH